MNTDKSLDQIAQDEIADAFTEVIEQVRKNTAMIEQIIKTLQGMNDMHDETMAGLENINDTLTSVLDNTKAVRSSVAEMADEAYRSRRKAA